MGPVLIAALALGFGSGLTYEAVCKQPQGQWQKVGDLVAKHDKLGIHLLYQRPVEVTPEKRWYEWVDKGGTVGPAGAAYLCFDEDPVNVSLYAAKDWMNYRYADVSAFRAWQGRQAEEARKAMQQAKETGVNYGWDGWKASIRMSAGAGPEDPSALIGQACPPGPNDGGVAPANSDQTLYIGGGIVAAIALVVFLKKSGRI